MSLVTGAALLVDSETQRGPGRSDTIASCLRMLRPGPSAYELTVRDIFKSSMDHTMASSVA